MRGIKTIAPVMESVAQLCGIELLVRHNRQSILSTPAFFTHIKESDPETIIADFETHTKPYHIVSQPNGDTLYGTWLNKTQKPNSWLIAFVPARLQGSRDEEVMSLLLSLADIINHCQADKSEIDELAIVLGHSYEELALYRRLQKSIRTGEFSSSEISALLSRLREIMQADLIFGQFPASPNLNITIADPGLEDQLDLDRFAADLMQSMTTVQVVSHKNYFILNRSSNEPAFSSLCKHPFRLMASQAVYKEHTYGWLGVVSFNFYTSFKRNHLNMLQATASQAALAGANIDLLQGLEGLTTQVKTFQSELAGEQGTLSTDSSSSGLHPGDFLDKAFTNLSQSIEATKALMLRSAQMASIGQMAAVFAHEVKQPVCALSGFLQLAQLKASDKDQTKDLKKMATAVGRISRIIKRFESFSRPHASKQKPVSLNHIAREVYHLVQPQLKINQIEGGIHRAADLPLIMGDGQGLQQAVLNLASNAIQSMISNNDHHAALQLTTYLENQHACLEVLDTGQGIPEALISKINEPYFTTKPSGKGMGLGLSVVSEIVEQHNGHLGIKSTPGKGSRFTIKIPAHPGPQKHMDGRQP